MRSSSRIPFPLLAALVVTTAGAQSDGSLRWPAAFTTLSTRVEGDIAASPTVGADGTVYVCVKVGSATDPSPSGLLFALNPNGTEKWRFTTPDWIDSTPAIASDGTIYFGCWDGKLYALRPDRSQKWPAVQLGPYITSSPAIGPDGTIYVGAGASLGAVNPDNGAIKWSFGAADWLDSSPAVGPDGTIYVGSWDDGVYAIRPDGTQRWRFATGNAVLGSPAVGADGTIYIGSQDLNVYAITPAGNLKWEFQTDDTIDGSPVLGADGTVYVATTGGRLLAIGPDGLERWRYPRASQAALNPIITTPAVRADGIIVLGTANNALHALRPDGTLLWQSGLGDWTNSSPLVTGDGIIYVGCADKKLYAFNSTASASLTDWAQFRRNVQRNGWQPMGAAASTTGRLSNVSVRTFAGAEENTLIVGFAIGGAGTRSLLVRGVGPSLSSFGVTGALSNPNITLMNGGSVLGTNDNWEQAPNDPGAIATTSSAVGAFPLPSGSLDAVLQREFTGRMPPLTYTVHVSGAGGATGVALMEVYDAAGAATARLVNISARSAVTAGTGTLIAGFVVGERPRTILVRGIGPALSGFGVSGALPNPQLRVFRGDELLAENNDWSASSNATSLASAAQAVGAFTLQSGSTDAVLLLTLPPGPYTAQVSGAANSSPNGVALVEVYEVP